MIRKVLWLGIAAVLGALAAGWPDIIRFARIKQISLGVAGHPGVVPAEGRRSYPQRAHGGADGSGDFDSASRGGPAL